MSIENNWRRALRGALALGTALALSGCFLSPGEFTSSLDLRKDGSFTYTYDGEMHFIALSDFATREKEFEAEDCVDEETYETRPCTQAELDEQRSEWEAKQAKDARQAEEMADMLGGLDPKDPDAAKEFTAALKKQKGWQSVEYMGDGLFEISYSLTSQAGHTFSFPAIEGFPMGNSFVQIVPRSDGTVRIDAPGFAPGNGNPMAAMMMGMAEMGSESDEAKAPKLPELRGQFTITTDGEILANNTDEGPQSVEQGQKLDWTVSRNSAAAPMALIKLSD